MGFTVALDLGPLSEQYLHGYNPLISEMHMMNHACGFSEHWRYNGSNTTSSPSR